MARGQLADALTHYHAAVGKLKNAFCMMLVLMIKLVLFSEGDPNNYLTLFKRCTVYLALGKTRFAIQDLSKVLELKPDFVAARLQRGTVYMKSGEFELAAVDFEDVVSTNKIINR